jgi:putative heme-binding domain-containing protein
VDKAAYELVSSFLEEPSLASAVAESFQVYHHQGDNERTLILLETLNHSQFQELPASVVNTLELLLKESEVEVQAATVRTIGILGIVDLDDELVQIARETRHKTSLRLAAFQSLGSRRPEVVHESWPFLLACLSPDSDAIDRLASAEIVARAQPSDQQLVELLQTVANDPVLSPSTFVPLLTRSVESSNRSAPAIFDYLSSSLTAGWMPQPQDLQPLLDRLKNSDAAGADKLAQAIAAATLRQRERLQSLESVLDGGDAARGRLVFQKTSVACATCHRFGDTGGTIGPDLSRIGAARTSRDLLESIVAPSATFAQGYESYVVVTGEGHSLTGMIVRQDGSHVILRDSAGADVRVARDEMEEIRRSPTSLMPDGFDRTLSREELRDLIAFLVSLK